MNLDDLSLKEAADVCGVSVATVRRKKDRLREVGGVCEPSGWHLSLSQLIAVGLTTKVVATPSVPAPAPVDPGRDDLVEALRAHIATLEADLARERARADRAETRLDRLLEAAPEEGESLPDVVSPDEPDVKKAGLRGWIRRNWGRSVGTGE